MVTTHGQLPLISVVVPSYNQGHFLRETLDSIFRQEYPRLEVIVMDGDALVGIITERHYARNVILKGRTSPATLVREIMERQVITVRPEQTVEECMALMTDKRGWRGRYVKHDRAWTDVDELKCPECFPTIPMNETFQ